MLEQVAALFAFDAYWKIAAFVVMFGAGLAYAVTQATKKGAEKYRAAKGKPEPWWWSSMLRGLAVAVGTASGVVVDLSASSISPAEVDVSAVWFSALLGAFCGAFCTLLVWVVLRALKQRGFATSDAPLDNSEGLDADAES